MSVKEAAETRLNHGAREKFGPGTPNWAMPGATIGKSIEVARQIDAERNFIVLGAGLNSTLFAQAQEPGSRGQYLRRPRRRSGGAARTAHQPAAREDPISPTRSRFMVTYLGADHADHQAHHARPRRLMRG
jgi:hypothetical protein